MNEKWLIRLKDCENNDLIAAYYTENPTENLKTFYFCKEHDLEINIPNDYDNENYKYANKEAGSIYDIEVGFGNHETYSYIDVWLENIY